MKKGIIIASIIILLMPIFGAAAEVDSDQDGLSDEVETKIYYTDPNNPDTDGDGYNDKLEIINGYSPHFKGKRLYEVDQDNDGLPDAYELPLHCDIKNPDTNGNGESDGQEFAAGYDCSKKEKVKLQKRIEVSLSQQKLNSFLGPVRLKNYIVSTGRPSMPTPAGNFSILKKQPKAWSRAAGLWMPYWMQFYGADAFHELPEWPNGKKEGADHLGRPVSHGCIRLGIGPAKELYDWAEIGTKVIITK
jgi:hypothetical protein